MQLLIIINIFYHQNIKYVIYTFSQELYPQNLSIMDLWGYNDMIQLFSFVNSYKENKSRTIYISVYSVSFEVIGMILNGLFYQLKCNEYYPSW